MWHRRQDGPRKRCYQLIIWLSGMAVLTHEHDRDSRESSWKRWLMVCDGASSTLIHDALK